MAPVFLRSPRGKVRQFDSTADSALIAHYTKLGAETLPSSDTTATTGLAGLSPEARAGINAGRRDLNRQVIRNAAPTLAGWGATALVPEAAPFAPLLRILAAGGGSAATDVAGRAAMGEQQDPMGTFFRGTADAGGQTLAEVLPPLMHALARHEMGAAMTVPAAAERGARRVGGQQAGHAVPYSSVDLADQALRERVAPGPTSPLVFNNYPEVGSDAVRRLQAEPMAERGALYGDLANQGVRGDLRDFTTGYPALDAEFAKSKRPELNKWLAKRKVSFAGENMQGGAQGAFRKLTKYTPQEISDLATTWSTEAEAVLKDPRASARATAEARFKQNVADAARNWLRDLTPPAPGQSTGRVQQLNARYASLAPFLESITASEAPRAAGSNMPGLKALNPMEHLPYNVRGRLALGLTEPAMQQTVAGIPRTVIGSLYALAPYLNQPDTLATGGK